MYDQERKIAYIEYAAKNDTDREIYRNLFRATEESEQKAEKDLCEMDLVELVACLKTFEKKSVIREKKSRISAYLEWCRACRYCDRNHLDRKAAPMELVFSMIDSFEEKYYMSHQVYEQYKEKILAAENGSYYASVFMAVYEGIAGAGYGNLIHLKEADIDFKQHKICLYDGTVRRISDELTSLLIEAAKTKELTSASGTVKKFQSALYGDSVWKDIGTNNKVLNRKFEYMIKEKMRELVGNPHLTKRVIEDSGFFYFVVSKALERGYDIAADMKNKNKRGMGSLNLEARYKEIFEQYGSERKFSAFKVSFEDWIKYIE